MEPVPYAFVSVNRRNNEARTRHRVSVDVRIFLQCGSENEYLFTEKNRSMPFTSTGFGSLNSRKM